MPTTSLDAGGKNLWHHRHGTPAVGGRRGSNPVRNLGGIINIGQKPHRNHMLSRAMTLLVICLHCAPFAYAVDSNPERYRELKSIAFFGAVSVSVHNTGVTEVEVNPDFSFEELTQYLRLQVANYLPDIPYRGIDASGQADTRIADSMGQLFCRIWVDSRNTPAVFQVRCHVSTSTHFNIIDDVSFGYGPKEMAPAIVREQINEILKGFASIFLRTRDE